MDFLFGEPGSPSVPAPVVFHAVAAGEYAPDACWPGLLHGLPGVPRVPRPTLFNFPVGESDSLSLLAPFVFHAVDPGNLGALLRRGPLL